MTIITKFYVSALTALSSKKGAAMVEYALLVGLVALVALVGVTSLGNGLSAKFGGLTALL